MRRLRGSDLAIGLEDELRKRHRPLMKLFRGVRRNSFGNVLVNKKLEDMAADHGFNDIIGPDDGTILDDKTFMDRLLEMLKWFLSPEGLEGLKAFLDIVIEFIKALIDTFAEGSPERKALEEQVAGLMALSNEVGSVRLTS